MRFRRVENMAAVKAAMADQSDMVIVAHYFFGDKDLQLSEWREVRAFRESCTDWEWMQYKREVLDGMLA